MWSYEDFQGLDGHMPLVYSFFICVCLATGAEVYKRDM